MFAFKIIVLGTSAYFLHISGMSTCFAGHINRSRSFWLSGTKYIKKPLEQHHSEVKLHILFHSNVALMEKTETKHIDCLIWSLDEDVTMLRKSRGL